MQKDESNIIDRDIIMKKWIGVLGLLSLCSCGLSDSKSSSQSEDKVRTSFSILTYNVQSRPIVDAARARRNLPLIGAKLDEFDIVGIQECFSRCELLLNASQLSSQYYFKDREYWWTWLNSGLAGLSRFPLVEVKKHFFKSQAEFPDQLASKGILLTRYLINEKTVDVYNTQLQAGSSQGAHKLRQEQAEELVTFVGRESSPEHTVIVLGDFNLGPVRPGKPLAGHELQQDKSLAGIMDRTTVLSNIMKSLQLVDASDLLLETIPDRNDRVLFRSGSNTVFKPILWEDQGAQFVDAEGNSLSRGAPIAVRFELE